jgi:hypothetical protein
LKRIGRTFLRASARNVTGDRNKALHAIGWRMNAPRANISVSKFTRLPLAKPVADTKSASFDLSNRGFAKT